MERIPCLKSAVLWVKAGCIFTIQRKNQNKQLADLCFSENHPSTFTNWKSKHL